MHRTVCLLVVIGRLHPRYSDDDAWLACIGPNAVKGLFLAHVPGRTMGQRMSKDPSAFPS